MSKYITEFKHATENVYVLDVSFSEMPPDSAAVLSALRAELPQFIDRCDGDILATAWYCPDKDTEEMIPLPDGSRNLLFRRSDNAVLNWNDYIGQTSDTKETEDCFSIVSSHKTIEGIKPEKSWFSITALFKRPMSAPDLYNTLTDLCADWAVCGLEVSAYAYYGDKGNRLTWQQIRDTDNAFVFAHWDPATGEISRKGRLLRKLDLRG